MTNPIFTIGHSNHPLEHFAVLLAKHSVQVIVDVRSSPSSARNPQFNRGNLRSSLTGMGVRYLFLGRELGARRTEREAYEGRIAKYELIANLPSFASGIDRIKEGSSRFRVALMCAERDPLQCHRAVLVCRYLKPHFPSQIHHILADGNLESHAEFERRLLTEASLNADQADMFSANEEPILDRAYRAVGLKIAFEETATNAD